MKIINFFAALIISLILISCSENQRDESNLEGTKPANEQTVNQNNKMNRNEVVSQKAPADYQEKVDKGEIIVLTKNGSLLPYESDGNTIKTIMLPDGKQYQVEVDNDDKAWITIADKGTLQVIELNDKFYLFDDKDQAYELKVVDNELVAEATSITEELLAIDDDK